MSMWDVKKKVYKDWLDGKHNCQLGTVGSNLDGYFAALRQHEESTFMAGFTIGYYYARDIAERVLEQQHLGEE